MRAIYREGGKINEALCRQEKLPGKSCIHKLFGGYVQAYVAAGLPSELIVNGALGIRSMHEKIQAAMEEFCEKAAITGATVDATPVWNVLMLNGAIKVKVTIASSRRCSDCCRAGEFP